MEQIIEDVINQCGKDYAEDENENEDLFWWKLKCRCFTSHLGLKREAKSEDEVSCFKVV